MLLHTVMQMCAGLNQRLPAVALAAERQQLVALLANRMGALYGRALAASLLREHDRAERQVGLACSWPPARSRAKRRPNVCWAC